MEKNVVPLCWEDDITVCKVLSPREKKDISPRPVCIVSLLYMCTIMTCKSILNVVFIKFTETICYQQFKGNIITVAHMSVNHCGAYWFYSPLF